MIHLGIPTTYNNNETQPDLLVQSQQKKHQNNVRRHSCVFIFIFEQILHIVLVFLLLTLSK